MMRFGMVAVLLFAFIRPVLAGETVTSCVVRTSAPAARQDVVLFRPAPSTGHSRKLVFLYSLLVPGMGDLYLHNWDVRAWGSGKYFFAAEVMLWAGHLYGLDRSAWLRSDARAFAARYGGVNWNYDKPKNYSTNIGKFADIYAYNDVRRRNTGLENLYEEGAGQYWSWDTEAHRKHYDALRISSQQNKQWARYLVFGMVVNHVLGAVNSLREFRRLQRSLGVEVGASIMPDTRRAGRPGYGYQLEFRRIF